VRLVDIGDGAAVNPDYVMALTAIYAPPRPGRNPEIKGTRVTLEGGMQLESSQDPYTLGLRLMDVGP
jgi:hypothetical protein